MGIAFLLFFKTFIAFFGMGILVWMMEETKSANFPGWAVAAPISALLHAQRALSSSTSPTIHSIFDSSRAAICRPLLFHPVY